MISQLFLPILGTLLCYVVFHVLQLLYYDLTSPLRNMVGPKWRYGDDALVTDKWRQEFGPNFMFRGMKRIDKVRELHTSDIKAIAHIISHSNVYRKAPFALYTARRLFGNGILTSELDVHKRQNPAFGPAQIRLMSDVFVDKASQLRDIWDAQITADDGNTTIEVLAWLRRMTLDVIGEAGFNYQFDGLKQKPNELNQLFGQLFANSRASQRAAAWRLSQGMIPFLRLFPGPGSKVFEAARTKMFKIGNELVERTKAAESAEPFSGRRDLLSLLIRANVATDIPEHQRLTNEEVIGQIPTFFIAGHETTSTASSWALHALSVNREAQTKLREELLTVETDTPTMDELNSLVYLEWVVRETMRVHSPLVFAGRMAMEDDVLPLSKPYIDPNGGVHDSLPIPKGQLVHIPILAVNTDPEIWGPDAAEFRPERWEHVPEAAKAVPGASPHNCIGFRFTLVEQKALLFALIRAFEFEMAVPKGGIGRSPTPLQRPVVLGNKEKIIQMPLIVKRYLKT
ncbi:cytochrome P450 [Mycena metata]|uniref:Cytochrome P450 n=1 Tax=Mycena metata TaxID=1033252 RepID=A0AAD7IQE5_9AGAR|nr:cytochrome P450 [Mycena metata]